MSAPATLLDPLRETLVVRALDAACAVVGVDRPRVFEPNRHLAGRARLTAACALTDADRRDGRTGTAGVWAARLSLNDVSLAPTQRVRRGVTPAMIAAVIGYLAGGALPGRMAEADRHRKGRPKAPKSDLDLARKAAAAKRAERDARIIAARMAGQRPTEIALREGMDQKSVSKILTRSGKAFPALKAGPAATPVKAAREAAPTGTPNRLPRQERPQAPAEIDRKPWVPLEGSAPVRLVDHRHGCRWPLEIGDGRTPFVCNLKTTAHGLYCERHRALSRPRAALAEQELAGAAA